MFVNLSYSQSFTYDEKKKIFDSREYVSVYEESNGMIEFKKIEYRELTQEDIKLAKLNWGTNTEEDKRYLPKDIGKKIKVEKRGFIDAKSLREVIPGIYDELDEKFINDVVLVKKQQKYLLLDKNGDSIQTSKIKDYIFIDINRCGSFKNCYIEREGIRRVKSKNGKWGCVDEDWKIVIPFIYDSLKEFSNGLCFATQDRVNGILDKTGYFKPTSAGISIGNYYQVYKDYNVAIFNLNNKKGIIDSKGKILISAKYNNLQIINGEIYEYKDGKSIQLDISGNVIKSNNNQITQNSNNISVKNEKSRNTNKEDINTNENKGCETTILEYEKFANEFIKYCNFINKNPQKFNLNEYLEWENKARKQQDLVMKCSSGANGLRILKTMEKVLAASKIGYGNSSSYTSSGTSTPSTKKSETSNSKQNNTHSFKVVITWNNPVATNSHQSPTVQNGILEYFYERSGSYKVKPVCPVCSKKHNNTISGFAAGKDSKVVNINCN